MSLPSARILLPYCGEDLLWGCLAGMVEIRTRPGRLEGPACFLAGFPILVLAWDLHERRLPMPAGLMEVLSVSLFGIGSALIVFGAWRSEGRWLVRPLTLAPVAYLGRISYGLYAFHLPVLRGGWLYEVPYAFLIPRPYGALAMTIGLAALSWRLLRGADQPAEGPAGASRGGIPVGRRVGCVAVDPEGPTPSPRPHRRSRGRVGRGLARGPEHDPDAADAGRVEVGDAGPAARHRARAGAAGSDFHLTLRASDHRPSASAHQASVIRPGMPPGTWSEGLAGAAGRAARRRRPAPASRIRDTRAIPPVDNGPPPGSGPGRRRPVGRRPRDRPASPRRASGKARRPSRPRAPRGRPGESEARRIRRTSRSGTPGASAEGGSSLR